MSFFEGLLRAGWVKGQIGMLRNTANGIWEVCGRFLSPICPNRGANLAEKKT